MWVTNCSQTQNEDQHVDKLHSFLSVFKVVAPALWRRGLCYGQLIKVFEGPSREQCLLSCIDSHQKCEWTSFDFD
jgi:hypothetical protein